MEISFEVYLGKDIALVISDLARLRIRVFKEWPYLYEGSIEYEKKYLREYCQNKDNLVVVAKVDDVIVGASTAMPLENASLIFQEAFAETDFSVSEIFYFGESVLLPEFRGRGIGRCFFDYREIQARKYGSRFASFCSIVREEGDCRKPRGTRELAPFWKRLGYRENPNISCFLCWKDINQNYEADHLMNFWIRELK